MEKYAKKGDDTFNKRMEEKNKTITSLLSQKYEIE